MYITSNCYVKKSLLRNYDYNKGRMMILKEFKAN